jgi:putative phage-type endonuclease
MITKEQLKKRSEHLGSSDIAAILNLDPFKTPYDVWLEKTGKLVEEKETPAMTRGNFLEPALLNFAESVLGKLIRRAPERVSKELNGLIIDHPDAILKAKGEPVEGKSQGAYSKEIWGEPGTDQVPDRVVIQSEVHILCYEAEICHIPAYLSYREFQMFAVQRDKDIIDAILEAAASFWRLNVLADSPPAGVTPSLSIVRRIKRLPDVITILPDEVVAAYQKANEIFKAAEEEKNKTKARLETTLWDEQKKQYVEAGRWSGGIVTFKEQVRVDPPRLEERISKFRVLRFLKENNK